MNLNRLVLVLIGVMLISFGIGALIIKASGSVISETANVMESREFSTTYINNINLEVSSTDVNIIPTDKGFGNARLHGTSNGRYELDVSLDGTTVNIEVKRKDVVVFFGFSDVDLDLYIPIEYNKNLSVNTSSGDVNISDFELDKFSYVGSSADIKINSITVNELSMVTSSGDIDGENIKGDTNIVSSSGDVELKYYEFDNNLKIDTSSGDVEIYLDSKSEFKLSVETSSGKINTMLPISVNRSNEDYLKGTVGTKDNFIDIKTSSGDVDLR